MSEFDPRQFSTLAEDFLNRWNCQPDGDMFFTHSSLLWPVKGAAGSMMLKITNPDDDEAQSGEILKYYAGNGAVRLVESQDHILLLERIESSSAQPSLETMVLNGQNDQATRIICDVIAKLHAAANPKPEDLIPLMQRSKEMRNHVEEGRVKPDDRPAFAMAYALSAELMEEARGTETLLHGDIHHFNILHSAQRGWLAIDPKGIWGPRVYEYANSLCNPYMHGDIVANTKRMDRQASLIAETAGLDKDLLLKFTFLHAMQCAAWSLSVPDQKYWVACAEAAAKLSGLQKQNYDTVNSVIRQRLP